MQPYGQSQIDSQLTGHPGWTMGNDGMLHAEFTFPNFMQAMVFANAVALLAEAANHHPDMCIHNYKRLSIRLMTHAAGGVTDKDFALIAQIDELPRPQ